MKSHAIVNRIGCCLIIILSVFNSSAQPDYLSRDYIFREAFHQVTYFDSGYILRNNYTLYKTDFNGDTIKSYTFRGRFPGTYTYSYLKSQDKNIILSGTYKASGTGQSMLFISKLNFNLDTLWVRYYPGLVPGYIAQYNDTLAVIYGDSSYKIHVQIFNSTGELIETRIHPKYPGSLYALIHNVAAVNTKVFAIALEIFYKSSWDQNYYNKPIICVSDTNGYNYFESGFAYLSGSGTSESYIFYDTVSNRIKHFYHFAQMDNYVKLYEHSLSGQLMASKGIYYDDAYVTNEIWYPCDISLLQNGCFVICGQYDKITQNIKGGFIMRCGPHGEWSWFRKYKEIHTSGMDNGTLYAIVETENQFLASVGQGANAWLLVVDSLGCEAPGVCWVGQEEISAPLQETQLEVFPNPAGEEVWVKINGHLAGIEIYAMNGQKMPLPALSAENPLRIDTRAWPAGLYMVRATLPNGRVLTQKVMKCR